MIHISLFSGIGGFDLAAQWAGWTNVASCEISEFPRKVLQYHFPQAYHHDDIHTLTYQILNDELEKRFGKEWRSDDIVLSGGFPCQPYSLAGKRLGKDDPRHLWPEMLRVIREIQPKWVVGENVFGLVNWNGGLVFNEVQSDLESAGYEVQAYVLPAASVGAPHRRDRVWFVAYSDSDAARSSKSCGWFKKSWNYKFLQQDKWRKEAKQHYRFYEFPQFTAYTKGNGNRRELRGLETENAKLWKPEECWEDNLQLGYDGGVGIAPNPKGKQNQRHGQGRFFTEPAGADEQGLTSDTDSSRFPLNTCGKLAGISGQDATFKGSAACGAHAAGNGWQKFPTQSPVCRRDDGLSSRLDGITFSKWRNESIKAYGNAVVPQVVYQIFKAINEYK